MKAYPKYKESGVIWFNEIPQHWSAGHLKFELSNNDGGVWGNDTDETGTIVLRSTEITVDGSWQIDNPAVRQLTDTEIEKALLITGDLLITKSSGSEAHIGKTALVTPEVESLRACYSNFTQRIRPTAKLDSRYLHYFLNSFLAREQYNYQSTTTTGLANLNAEIIGNLRLPFIPLPEQQAIADFLDRKTAQIDTLIEKKQRQIDLLQEQRTALINHAVTKGLNPDVRMKDSGVEWLGEIPSHWEMARLRWLTKSVVTGKTPPTIQQEYYEDADVNWFSPGDFNHQMILRESKKKINKLAIDDGQAPIYEKDTVLLIGIGATLGKIGIIDKSGSSNQQINAIAYNEKIYPYYGAYYLNTIKEIVVSQANFATLPILNQSQTKDLLHLIPPYEEQTIIIKYIQEKEEQIQNLIRVQEKMIESYQEYRTALISEAVTGKIDVRDGK